MSVSKCRLCSACVLLPDRKCAWRYRCLLVASPKPALSQTNNCSSSHRLAARYFAQSPEPAACSSTRPCVVHVSAVVLVCIMCQVLGIVHDSVSMLNRANSPDEGQAFAHWFPCLHSLHKLDFGVARRSFHVQCSQSQGPVRTGATVSSSSKARRLPRKQCQS